MTVDVESASVDREHISLERFVDDVPPFVSACLGESSADEELCGCERIVLNAALCHCESRYNCHNISFFVGEGYSYCLNLKMQGDLHPSPPTV